VQVLSTAKNRGRRLADAVAGAKHVGLARLQPRELRFVSFAVAGIMVAWFGRGLLVDRSNKYKIPVMCRLTVSLRTGLQVW